MDVHQILRSLAEASPETVLVLAPDGAVAFAAGALGDAVGRSVYDLLPPSLAELLRDDWERALATGEPVRTVLPYQRPDETHHVYESRCAPVRDASGAVVGLAVLARDITAERGPEETLTRVGAVQPHVLHVTDVVEGRVVFLNPAVEACLGYPTEAVLAGEPSWASLVHPDDADVLRGTLNRVALAEEGVTVESEYRMRHASGEWRWFVARDAVLSRDASGAVRTMVGTAHDVTESRRMREQLSQASRMASVGVLATGVVHELNNPLTYVMFNLAYVNRELPRVTTAVAEARARIAVALGEERAKELLGDAWDLCDPDWLSALVTSTRDAIQGASKVRDVVWDLRSFATAKGDASEPVQLERALDAAVDMAANQLRYRAQVAKSYGDVPWVLGTQSKIAQVFLNLLLNAAQAIPEETEEEHRIALRTRVVAGEAVVEIEDDGVGIPPEHMDRLFDPGFTTRRSDGAGLGLSICQTIVQAYGGRVAIESTPGQGTIARVIFPIPPHERAPEGPSEAATGAEQRPRVLVVDDDRLLGRAISRACTERYDLRVLGSGAEAVEAIRNNPVYDLILCDLMMPRMSGMDLYEWIRREHPELVRKIALMTGGTFTPRASRFLEEVSNPVIEKPFDIEAFPDTLARLIEEAKT